MPWTEQDRAMSGEPNYATPSKWDKPSPASVCHYEIGECIEGNFWNFAELVTLRDKYKQSSVHGEALFLKMLQRHDPNLASNFYRCMTDYLANPIPGYKLRLHGGVC